MKLFSNINSVISSPNHDEVIPLPNTATLSDFYTMRGYAYSGNDKKVTRVEISLDEGTTWELTDLQHPEEGYQHSTLADEYHRTRHWCWCFWSYAVPIQRLVQCKELIVRAWDQTNNTQPMHLTWNVMGMMNNCVFRVKVRRAVSEAGLSLKFEHPTQPGNVPGGWMVKDEEASPKSAEQSMSTSSSENLKSYTLDEITKHDKEDDCWIIYDGRVYDCTKFLDQHPGGADSILINAGMDCTEEFKAIHSSKAHTMLASYMIGSFVQDTGLPTPAQSPSPSEVSTFLRPKSWQSVSLVEKCSLSHNTRLFRFALNFPDQRLGLPVGKHIFLRAKIPSMQNKSVIRAYTPTTPPSTEGHFDLIVKVYFAGVDPRFPEGGMFSQYLEQLRIGDTVEVKGPLGGFVYEGAGRYFGQGGKRAGTAKEIGMICGGTGITPLWQVVQDIFKNGGLNDETRVSLLVGNRSEQDILLRKELDDFATMFGCNRMRVW